MRWMLLLTLLLAVVTMAAYLPVRQHPFLNYDDDAYVTDNSAVRAGLKIETVEWAFTTYHAANWHPVTWLSHALDCDWYDLDPAGHHTTNLVLHALNALLLFWVLTRATDEAGLSAFVAALFALHPINVESVAWVAERKNLLSMMFFLLALGAWRWYAGKPQAHRYAVVAILYALGLMAKPQVITFPFVLLLWDFWPLQRVSLPRNAQGSLANRVTGLPRRTPLQLVAEKIPLLLLSLASALITMRAQRLGGAVNPDNAMMARIANAIVAYARYLKLAVWPTDLAILYPFHRASLSSLLVAASAILLIAITALAARYWRTGWLPVGWFWFLGTLVPMIGLVQVGRQAMADRYAYLSFIGLFILAVWGLAALAKRFRVPTMAQVVVGIVVCAALATATFRQLSLWSDNVLLWTHATEVTRGNFTAEDYLGLALEASGREWEALPHFERSAQIEPLFPYPYIHMGIYLHQQGDLKGALRNYVRLIGLTEQDEYHYAEVRHRIFVNMASAYAATGDLPKARDSFAAAVRLNPDVPEEWLNLGTVSQQIGDFDTAIKAYSQAVKLKPTPQGYQMLATVLRQAGKMQEAEAATQQAARLGAPHTSGQ